MQVYKCFKSDFAELEKKIKRITKKLSKYNLSYSFEVLGESVEEVTVWDYNNYDNIPSWQFTPKNRGKRAVEVISYTFEMESLKLGEFEVLAVLEHNVIENSNENLVHVIKENALVPVEYRTKNSYCEHCNSDRKRNKTVLLINPEGEIKQVGSTCIKEYTGIDGINIIGNYQDIHDIIIKDLALDYERIDYYQKYDKTIDYLASCIQLIDTKGYEKDTTKYKAWEICGTEYQDTKYMAIAEKVKEYFTNRNFVNDFLNNIRLCLSNEYTKINGFVAYAYLAYQKEMENEEKKRKIEEGKKNSSYVGEVGQKIQTELTFKKKIAYETHYSYHGETSYILLFEDAEGNIYKWNTAKYMEIEEGQQVKIKGTIKDHSEYSGAKQTILTRCKIA